MNNFANTAKIEISGNKSTISIFTETSILWSNNIFTASPSSSVNNIRTAHKTDKPNFSVYLLSPTFFI